MTDKEKIPNDFLMLVSAPAKRALENKGIDTLEKLANFTESEILQFHGIGKSSIPKLSKALSAKGLSFKK
jgi:DNA-directed RNA polymerase alpha subunit